MKRAVKTEQDRDTAIRLVESRGLPFTLTFAKGAPKSHDQDRLEQKWVKEAAEQLQDETPDEKRAYCKLHFGVPILRFEDEDFKAAYDRVIKPLAYELKLQAMAEPLDFPCTRLMTTKQKSQYLDAVYQHFRAQGVQLTEPEDKAA